MPSGACCRRWRAWINLFEEVSHRRTRHHSDKLACSVRGKIASMLAGTASTGSLRATPSAKGRTRWTLSTLLRPTLSLSWVSTLTESCKSSCS